MSNFELNKPLMTYSDVESKRFGMRVFRGTIDEINEKQILSSIIENKVDMAILRIPVSKQYQISRLEKTGLPYIVADTLVYYSVDLTTYLPKPIRNKDLVFQNCSLEHIDSLSALVEIIFASYTNHYTSNPYLKREDIIDGYKEWACAYIAEDNNKRFTWVVKKGQGVVGFATCGCDKKIGEGVLYGVLPSASGNGIYSDIIRFTQQYLKDIGCCQMIVSTQIQNFSVQKVWNREGFTLKDAYITLHINSFMNLSKEKVTIIDNLTISSEDIERWGKISGDTNIVHYDDDYARQLGLNKRIAHGLISNSLISKYIGTVFPGHGTLFLGYSYQFLRPLYVNDNYKVLISFPYIDEIRGIYKSLIKIIDYENNLCLFSYSDLYKK
ncbi:MAG: GNAT family N-acetyltransferase [Christensenellales bacterium]|jgi:GNAT superfamily N-acetyltransferase